MPVENGAGFLSRRTQAIVHAAVTGDEEALEAALAREEPGEEELAADAFDAFNRQQRDAAAQRDD